MRPLAIVTGDWHLHDFRSFNEGNRRTDAHFTAIKNMGYAAKLQNLPILFTGDILHAFGKISLALWYQLEEFARNWEEREYPPICGISGNHDQEQANYDNTEASKDSWTLLCRLFPKVFVNTNWKAGIVDVNGTKLNVMGIPYLTYNKTLDKWVSLSRESIRKDMFNILLIHTDLYGAMDNGREVGTVEVIPKNMEEYFKDFDLVLSGHIHLPQKLGRKIYMVGAPQQQRRSDAGGRFGYWTIWKGTRSLQMEFNHLDMLPEFKYLEPNQSPPDTFHYWIPTHSETESEEVEMGFSSKASKGTLVRNYMKAIGDPSVTRRLALTKLINNSLDD